MTKQILKIAVIVTDESETYLNKNDFFGLYDKFVRRYGVVNDDDEVEIITQRFSAQNLEWPIDPLNWKYIITGSVANAYDQDEWILLLKQRIVELDNNEIKMFGICFGHQIIAESLGGKVGKNPLGWELGQRTIKLNEEVQLILSNIVNNNQIQNNNLDSANSSRSSSPSNLILDGASTPILISTPQKKEEELKDFISIYQIHQDHVTLIPKDMISIGSTEISSVQGLLKESKKTRPGKYHVISFQGHPEFTSDYIKILVTDLIREGINKDIVLKGLSTITPTSCQTWLSNLCYNFFKY